jgi:hypothetical protein
LNGRQKLSLILNKSLESAIENHKAAGKVDYSKNPKMLYALLVELKDEIAPMFILPIIKQGIKDGSIKTDYPKELSELLALVVNLWINPIIFDCSEKDMLNKCRLFSSMLESFNLDILDEKIIKQLKKLK